jgi:hypothetical protein
LRAFVGRGYLDKADAKQMFGYEHGGGFSVDASVWIGAQGDTDEHQSDVDATDQDQSVCW